MVLCVKCYNTNWNRHMIEKSFLCYFDKRKKKREIVSHFRHPIWILNKYLKRIISLVRSCGMNGERKKKKSNICQPMKRRRKEITKNKRNWVKIIIKKKQNHMFDTYIRSLSLSIIYVCNSKEFFCQWLVFVVPFWSFN